MSNAGLCDQCAHSFSYTTVHNGFNDTAFAYCDTCGCTAFFSAWSKRPEGIVFDHGTIKPEMEPYIASCACGGHFRANASPRCPHCHEPLSAEIATTYIEANAPGTAKGWRWQRNWKGLYALIIEGRSVKDPWDPAKL